LYNTLLTNTRVKTPFQVFKSRTCVLNTMLHDVLYHLGLKKDVFGKKGQACSTLLGWPKIYNLILSAKEAASSIVCFQNRS
jgi:hypothetical protein